MTFVSQIAIRTPFYIWLLLIYVIWQGIQALRPRTQPLARVFLVPLLFIAFGVVPLVVGQGSRLRRPAVAEQPGVKRLEITNGGEVARVS